MVDNTTCSNLENYKLKLKNFNSTEKYKREMQMLYRLICPLPNEKIVDIGCGIGTCIRSFSEQLPQAQWLGYDVNKMYIGALNKIPYNIDKAYFMHSFSHIKELTKLLVEIHDKLNEKGEIIIVTPNPEWIWKNHDANYKPDETVVEHYSINQLKEILSSLFEIVLIGQFDSDNKRIPLFGKDTLNERIFIKAIKKYA